MVAFLYNNSMAIVVGIVIFLLDLLLTALPNLVPSTYINIHVLEKSEEKIEKNFFFFC